MAMQSANWQCEHNSVNRIKIHENIAPIPVLSGYILEF